jgi:hypothetical protein
MPFVVKNTRTGEYYPYSKYPRKGLKKTDLECAKIYPTKAGANQRRCIEGEYSKWEKEYYAKRNMTLPFRDKWEVLDYVEEVKKSVQM